MFIRYRIFRWQCAAASSASSGSNAHEQPVPGINPQHCSHGADYSKCDADSRAVDDLRGDENL